MDKNQIIEEMVVKFINDAKAFTSVDIGNAIKVATGTMDIRNRDVRDWLRANASSNPIFNAYMPVIIDTAGGQVSATLYMPHWYNADDYKDRDQKAYSPSDLQALKQQGATPSQSATPSGAATLVKQCRYRRRIQISGAISKALGWVPGQKVDLDKIMIHTGKLKPGLRVWHDGRFSIPRNVVGYGKDPVRIILKNDAIYFEKA